LQFAAVTPQLAISAGERVKPVSSPPTVVLWGLIQRGLCGPQPGLSVLDLRATTDYLNGVHPAIERSAVAVRKAGHHVMVDLSKQSIALGTDRFGRAKRVCCVGLADDLAANAEQFAVRLIRVSAVCPR
jgi:hypothetical protein